MKKITLLIVSMLMVTLLAMAQIKFIVYKADGSTIELLATEVDSIGFEGNNVQPETPDSPDNPDKPDSPVEPYIPNANGHEYVDLGLPSGTLWATMNVGATSAEDYGDYFCWGETMPRATKYDATYYKWYNNEAFTKYTKKDKKTVLEYEDDAARANWGGDWRMPTLKELEELVMNCIIDIIQKNGKRYYKLTSVKNNNSIILPIPGCFLSDGSGINSYLSLQFVELGAYYFSSEIFDHQANLDNIDCSAILTYYEEGSIDENTPEEELKLLMTQSVIFPRYYAASVRAVLPSKKVHTITFNANGGRGNMSSVDADYAELFTIPTNRFTHAEQDFVCWNTKADGSGKTYMETDKFSVSSDITLYAQWYETYTLKFDGNGGNGYMEDIEVKENSKVKLPINEFWHWDDEYEFAGWNTKPDGSGISYADEQEIFISSNMTLYAQWEEIGSDNEEGELPETLPQIMVPGDGYVTIAIYVPSNTCNGVILVGAGLGEGGTDDWAPEEKNNPFTELEGEDRWYTITVPYSDDLGVKAIALTPEGEAYWNNQWGMNSIYDLYENVVILQGQGYFYLENGGEPKLTELLDGSVVYIGIKEWKSAPCVERNKAGEATFTLTAVAPLPEGSVVGIVGNLSSEQNWNIESPIIMTQNGNTYTATCTVGDACEYKYVYSLDGGVTWSWDYIEEIYKNREMPLDLNAVDTVEEWIGIPAEE